MDIGNIKDNINMDKMKEKYQELKTKEQDGQLDDNGREMLDRLKQHFE